MINRNAVFASLLCSSVLFTVSAHAQKMDIDQADTLNFGAFYKDKKAAIKAWHSDSNKPTKTYTDTVAATKTTGATSAKSTDGDNSGKRYEIRARYTLTRSTKTPYSAFYVLEPLAKKAARLCPKGWKKLSEHSEPIEHDYYLYQEIECL